MQKRDHYLIFVRILFSNSTNPITPTQSPLKSFEPTSLPSTDPSFDPSPSPSSAPSSAPTLHPSASPSLNPSTHPSSHPTIEPTYNPTLQESLTSTTNIPSQHIVAQTTPESTTTNSSDFIHISSTTMSSVQSTSFYFTTGLTILHKPLNTMTNIAGTIEPPVQSVVNTETVVFYASISDQTEMMALYVIIAILTLILILVILMYLRRVSKKHDNHQSEEDMPGRIPSIREHQLLHSKSRNDVEKGSFDQPGSIDNNNAPDLRNEEENDNEDMENPQLHDTAYVPVNMRESVEGMGGAHVQDTMKDDNLGVVAVNVQDTEGSFDEIPPNRRYTSTHL